ncbi:hypothetical protein ACIA8O_26950 [Kitasatospora sp. NPDC051853]|uniref:hypothetical protein n=1 Tax=Kitasatospora sp. NPDC051853 TaxID=3364058 RepID=UPI0037AEDD96
MSKRSSDAPAPYVLWKEVLPAYVMPAVMAGAGGLASGQPQLVVAALTTIGGTSALVAGTLTVALHRRPLPARPPRTPRLLAALAAGLAGAAAGLAVGLAASQLLPLIPALDGSPWPGRLPADLAISSAIASTIATFRWRGSRTSASAPSPASPASEPAPAPHFERQPS